MKKYHIVYQEFVKRRATVQAESEEQAIDVFVELRDQGKLKSELLKAIYEDIEYLEEATGEADGVKL